MATLGSLDLGYVEKESVDRNSNLMNIPLPGESTPFIFDFFGATRTITISGRKIDSLTNLRTFVTSLEGLISGQQEPITYTNTLGVLNSVTNVYVDSVHHEEELGDLKADGSQSEVRYDIVLQQATTL